MKKPLNMRMSAPARDIFASFCCCVTLFCSVGLSRVAFAGWTEGSIAYERSDYATALLEVEPLAKLGDWRAQHLLGRMYAAGEGVARDDQKAFSWYSKAAENGYGPSQNNLGVIYSEGRGVPRNDDQAVHWFRLAAEQGNAFGQGSLGLAYAEGRGVKRDDTLAVTWYRKAADGGNVMAQNNLANLYMSGRGVEKNQQEAVAWYRKAAEKGYSTAQVNLGGIYAMGLGVNKDEVTAMRWYRKAAEQGDAIAQRGLGSMYYKGLGVEKDERQAVYWYRKSAEQGDGAAQGNLGVMYAKGQGVPRDEQQAYFWYLLASAQGTEDATANRDVMERILSSSQRAEAQAAARNWKPSSSGSTAGVSAPFSGSRGSPVVATTVRPTSPDSTGSGFAVGLAQVVTNAHVVEECVRVTVGGGQPATVLSSDVRSDLALLAVPAKTTIASLRAGRLRQGDTIAVVGYPLRGLLASGAQVTAGNVSALAGMQNDSRFVQISAPVQPGNSGGPLVDSSGNVVGVVVSKLNAVKMAQLTGDIPQNVNFAVSPLTLQGFLDANGVDYQTAPSNKNLSIADVADIAKKYTVLVECWK